MIAQKSIEAVLQTTQVEDVLGDFVDLKKRGANLIGLCPFHDEKTPSFVVSPTKNLYKCFGCGQAGNGIKFLMEHEGMSFFDAVRMLAEKYNIPLEEIKKSSAEYQADLERESLYIVNQFAKDSFHKNLKFSDEGKSIGLSYFKERGFREFIIDKFELGYALDKKDAFAKHALDAGHNIESLRSLGLITKYESDFFRGRVMFPIHNLSGKVIAFGGRTLKTDKKIPKYLNSSDSEIYDKSKNLYGIYQSRAAIRKQDEAILVEGYTDVLALHQAGFENAVASSGTSLTKGQIKQIKRFSSNILLLFDGDGAGLSAALRATDLLLEQDINVKIVLLPPKEDPDSYLKAHGSEGLQEFIKEESKDFLIFQIDQLVKDVADDPIKKVGAVKQVVLSLSKISDPIKRALYVQQASKLLELPEQALLEELYLILKTDQKRISKQKEREVQKTTATPTSFNKNTVKDIVKNDHPQEIGFVECLMKFCHLELEVNDERHPVSKFMLDSIRQFRDLIESPLCKTVIDQVDEKLENEDSVDLQFFLNHSSPEVQKLAQDVSINPYTYANWEQRGLYLQTQPMPEENFQSEIEQVIDNLMTKKLRKMQSLLEDQSEQLSDMEYLMAFKKIKAIEIEIAERIGRIAHGG